MSPNVELNATPEEVEQGRWTPDDKGFHISANLPYCGTRSSWQVDHITTGKSDSALVDAAEPGDSEPLDFGRALASACARLVEGQEPLGMEFETVWEENEEQLYES